MEHLVVVLDGPFQTVAGGGIKPGGIVRVLLGHESLLLQLGLVLAVAVYQCNLEFLVLRKRLHLLNKLVVVEDGCRDAGGGKDGIETTNPLVLQLVERVPFCLLIEMLQNVAGNIGDILRRHERLVGVDAPHLVFPDTLFFLHRLDVVDAEGQHILVIDGVDDGIAVEPVAKSLFRSLEMRQTIAAGILRENRSPGESEHVVTLERLGDGFMHLIELRTMALIENQHHMRFEYRMFLVFGNEAAELLYGGDDNPAI